MSLKINPSAESEIARLFHQLGVTTSGKVLSHAQTDVPVDTGELRDSLAIEQDGEKRFIIGTSCPHALFVELGTKKMAAQPYLRPALEMAMEELQ